MPNDATLLRTLAELLMDLAWFLEGSDDDVIDPDDAVRQLEWISYRLRQLPPGDRSALIALIRERAESESEPAFQEFLKEAPQAFGLLDEDD
ncbi:hypothetical protein HII36_06465 [Nonomuraea sp. NN258]|uniref:hypothetical protein n=1 Tax=Nonomuraea antri TaxID=2730852 RepID=UPI001569E0B4|nr:hypothetical protein [Nonomuraea antri]NRQ31484.1 hypothetical protein [Nonomuraea antri]